MDPWSVCFWLSCYHKINIQPNEIVIESQERTLYVRFTLIFSSLGLIHYSILSEQALSTEATLFFPIYLGNFFLTFFFLWALLKALKHFSHYVAWLYMLASALKFGLFFLLLWPLFQADGEVTLLEKTTFLIPYCAGLFLETGILISKLNKI
ncbi:MAG: hypothetical protein ACPHSE_02785 [Flavobacteriaceae bacterium]